ncbi:MAG: molecular chaperone DnaJ [Alphaproteobacteria bacterium]
MYWLLIGFTVLGTLFLMARWFVTAEPREILRAGRWLAVLGGVAFLGFLASRGLWGAMFPLLMAGFMYYRRRAKRAAFTRAADPADAARTGKTSEVRTATLRMNLDHDTGTLDGSVLQGRFAGRDLGALSEAELIALLEECGRTDSESAQLLETYLDRRLGPAWRDRHDHAADTAPSGPGAMSRAEAFAVLGLEPGASDTEIRQAHHRLMKGMHPDQGGSTFLATKINQAKDLLLGKG